MVPEVFLASGGMLRGEEPKSERIRRGKVFCTQGTIATASLCRSGGEPGVREKKAGRGRRKGKREEVDPFPFSPASFFYFEFPFASCTSPMIHLVCPPKFCISFLSSISLGTTVIPSSYANVWGQIWCIMGDVQMATNSLTFLSLGASADSKNWFCQLIASWVSGLRYGLGKRRGEGRGPSLFPLFAPYFSKS